MGKAQEILDHASEISSLVSGDDLNNSLLVSTTSPLLQQDLLVQTQNWVNMESGTATTAPSTATTAPSTAPLTYSMAPMPYTGTAPLPLTAGPGTMEAIVPIVGALGDMPSAIQRDQRARPVVSIEQTIQSIPGYGTLPYISGPTKAPLPYAAMPAMSARPTFPMGFYGMPSPNWMSEREQMLQQCSAHSGTAAI